MTSVGVELKEARERLGLSAAEIEERTKVQLYKIEALESGDFGRLPDGIYLDGIIRAYAHEVGMDPEPLIRRARAERAQDADSPVLPAAPAPSKHPAVTAQEDFTLDNFDLPSPPTWHRSSMADEIERAAARAGLKPLPAPRQRSRRALALVALLAAAGWGAYFYEVSRRPSAEDIPVASSPTSEAAAVAPDAVAPPTGHEAPGADERKPDSNAGALARGSTATTGTTVPRARSQSPDIRPEAGTSPPARSAAPAAGKGAVAVAPAHDISGRWTLATHVESSSLAAFTGLSLGFDVRLSQSGNRVTGEGRKVTENGAAIAERAQTPISLAGTIEGERLTLAFTEGGTERPTEGRFVLLLEGPETFRGRFTSTAAKSSGTAVARRVEQP